MLRQALGWFALVIVFLVVFAVCIRLNRVAGPHVVFLVGSIFGAAWVATKASREMVDDFLAALRESGLKLETAAAAMGMVLSQLSRQVNHGEQLSASRIADLGAEFPDFERRFAVRRLKRVGGVAVIEDARIARILSAVESREGMVA